MLKVEECLDILLIERLRRAAGRGGLDGKDSFCWHIVLWEGEAALGAARLYRHRDGILCERPALPVYDENHAEMLFRTLLLKCEVLGASCIYTAENDGYFTQFGFAPCGGNEMRVDVKDLIYPKLCDGCNAKP